jgi:acyl carrier protein
MKEKLYNLLAEILEMESSEIDNSTGVGNCDNWDSISLLMIVSELEEAFEISFEPNEIESITNVEIITNLINKKRSN